VSATTTVLTATSRTETGKAVAHLRHDGKIPAVVFGHGLASINVTLDAHEFDHLRRTIHSNSIISLEIDGKAEAAGHGPRYPDRPALTAACCTWTCSPSSRARK